MNFVPSVIINPIVIHWTHYFSEDHPDKYHSTGTFDPSKGAAPSIAVDYSAKVGKILCKEAEKDKSICAITAAMRDGTGLTEFAKQYPERFFDVGIAEEHAVTFAGGLSASGMKPVVFLYSTFAQRVYDQISHDIAIQKLPLLLAIDRAGLVAGDGITHQGIFDCSMLTTLPGVEIYSPESYADLRFAFMQAMESKALSVVRYPKGQELIDYEKDLTFIPAVDNSCSYTEGVENAEIVLISYGRICYETYRALRLLEGKYSVGMVKLKKIYPLDYAVLEGLSASAKLVYVVEEGIASGGIAEKIAVALSAKEKKVRIRAIEGYVRHGSLQELLQECGLTGEQIAEDVVKILEE